MAALMLVLRAIGMAVGGALLWVAFVTLPPWFCGFAICRQSAPWTNADKIKGFITLKNPRLAKLLVPEYIGWNSYINTNIPIFFNRFTMNKYPERLSIPAFINYVVTALTSLAYIVFVTDFLFIRTFDPNWALWAFFALVGEAVIFFIISNWNVSGRREPTVIITRQGMKQIKAARRVKSRRKRAQRHD